MNRRLLLLSLLAVSPMLSGCISAEGWKRRVWSKHDLVEWYNEYEPTNSNLSKFGYAGSDEEYHYFITRPIDSYLAPQVPRSEITIADERPRSGLTSHQLYFYLVDPRNDFRKIPGDTGIKR